MRLIFRRAKFLSDYSLKISTSRYNYMKRSLTSTKLEKSDTNNQEDVFTKYIRNIHDLKREATTQLKILEIETKDNNISDLFNKVENIVKNIDEYEESVSFLCSKAPNYDFKDVKANGYRSFLIISNKCSLILLNHLRGLNTRSRSIWSRTSISTDVISYSACWYELSICLKLISEMIRLNKSDTSLFFSDKLLLSTQVNQLIDKSNMLRQDVFYGYCLGFHYCSSAQRILQVLSSFMSGYADSFISQKSGVFAMFNTLLRSFTCFYNPDTRGQLMSSITKQATIHFTKQFWNLGEHPLVLEAPNMILPPVEIAHHFDLAPNSFQYQQPNKSTSVEIKAPKYPDGISANIKLRLVCFRERPGLGWLLKQKKSSSVQLLTKNKISEEQISVSSTSNSKKDERSSRLLIHIHGGGFVAQSAKAHDMYIRSWAEKLNCPILSIDYSLAPECPFPVALDECVYAIIWAHRNLKSLGCHANARIVICGDSAGANLSICSSLKIAQLGIDSITNGIFLAYVPSLVAMSPSPARLMATLDPLLPVGILARCLLAYVGIDETNLRESMTVQNVENSQNQSKNDLTNVTDQSDIEKSPNELGPLDIVRRAPIPADPFMSPLLANTNLLSKLPPISIIGTHLDPLLDDCVELCKKLDESGVKVSFEVLHDIPHGFLNFVLLSRECELGSLRCIQMIEALFDDQIHDS